MGVICVKGLIALPTKENLLSLHRALLARAIHLAKSDLCEVTEELESICKSTIYWKTGKHNFQLAAHVQNLLTATVLQMASSKLPGGSSTLLKCLLVPATWYRQVVAPQGR